MATPIFFPLFYFSVMRAEKSWDDFRERGSEGTMGDKLNGGRG